MKASKIKPKKSEPVSSSKKNLILVGVVLLICIIFFSLYISSNKNAGNIEVVVVEDVVVKETAVKEDNVIKEELSDEEHIVKLITNLMILMVPLALIVAIFPIAYRIIGKGRR